MAEDMPRRRSTDGFSITRAVQILTLVSLAAGIGYNFRQVSETKEWQEKYDKEYVRRDVQEQELKSINYQLGDLRQQVLDLKTYLSDRRSR
jgi:hypothetical protein